MTSIPALTVPTKLLSTSLVFITVDNENNTLTGATHSHRTNVMHVQRVFLEKHGLQCDERVKDAKAISSTLKEIATGVQTHGHYITSKQGEPSFCTHTTTPGV